MASIAWSDQLLVLAARLGHAVAVTDGQGQTLSFAQLSRQSHQLAHSLLKQGISSGQSVGVWLPNSLDAVLCAYGIRLMGAAETPLSWSLAPQEFQWCCGLAQVNWVITRAERMEQVRAWETSKHAKSGSKTASGSDKTICCRDCSNNFLHKVTDQAFFASHGWQDPTRCKLCREKKKGVAPKSAVSKDVPMLAGGGGGGKH
jgi:acyl-CoA synthetase (AMP-forming)/AMP-acid ligase II